MLFSVLIAHYNNTRFLSACIKSVLSQSYGNWEIILVDDRSTDGFELVINSFSDNRIKVYRNDKNMGCAYTKRKCAEKAAGNITGFLDPDDMLAADAISIMMVAHAQKPFCSIIHSTHYICDESMNIIRIADYVKALPLKTPYLLLGDGRIHHFATFKKSNYDNTSGIFPVRKIDKAIDQDLYYLLEEEGEVFYIEKPLYYYRIHQGGISTLGKEALSTMAHYAIAEEACLRRITKLKKSSQHDAGWWIKKYRTRYYKIKILNSYRNKKWIRFLCAMMVFPFVGGMENVLSYSRKLPKEGAALLKKSFVVDYKILK